MTRPLRVLAIAGTDPTGGAGLVADGVTLSALGVQPVIAVTAVVAQNRFRADAPTLQRASCVRAQIEMVLEESAVDAVKIGMLGRASTVADVARFLETRLKDVPSVLDPVLQTSSGRKLLSRAGHILLKKRLLPCVTVVTPNLGEAALLLGAPLARTLGEMRAQAKALRQKTPWVLLKGGHLPGRECPDILAGPGGFIEIFQGPRLEGVSPFLMRGTGCRLSSALARFLLEDDVPEAARKARDFVRRRLSSGVSAGK